MVVFGLMQPLFLEMEVLQQMEEMLQLQIVVLELVEGILVLNIKVHFCYLLNCCRIAVFVHSLQFDGSMVAAAGNAPSTTTRGAAGTVYTHVESSETSSLSFNNNGPSAKFSTIFLNSNDTSLELDILRIEGYVDLIFSAPVTTVHVTYLFSSDKTGFLHIQANKSFTVDTIKGGAVKVYPSANMTFSNPSLEGSSLSTVRSNVVGLELYPLVLISLVH